MRKLIIIFLFLISIANTYGQSGDLIENKVMKFSIDGKVDTINFIVVDTMLNEKKPIFLWCQGSLPIPLFVEIEDYGNYFLGGGVSNFDYEQIASEYHLVVISMPKTPIMAKKKNLNSSYQYIPNPDEPKNFSSAYIKANYLDNYVLRAKVVLDYLKKQNWVSNKKLVVAGHSQGTKVATKLAVSDSTITHIGLFAANPFGRIDQFVREARLNAQLGNITWIEADSIMNSKYDFYRQVQNRDSIELNPHFKAWKTFNETYYDDWLTLDIPIYLAYGTEDRISDLCDIVPFFFIEKGKDNLTLIRYLKLEHNFFEVNENGRANRKKGHWKEVMEEFIEWIE